MHSDSRRRVLVGGTLSLASMGLASMTARAQEKYPSRPVEFVVP